MRKRLLMIIVLCAFCGQGFLGIFARATPVAIDFDKDIASHMTNKETGTAVRVVDDNAGINPKDDLELNIRRLLVPNASSWGGSLLERTLRTIALWVIIIYLVWAGAQLVISGKKAEDLSIAWKNLGYITLGAMLIYGAGWLFGWDGIISFIPGAAGTQGLEWVIENDNTGGIMGQRGLFFQILTLLKGAAFFFAIVMVVFTGVKVIAAADADKSKKIMRGVLNVVAALAIMQVVDLIYYMASAENFAEQAMEFIFTVARIFGYIYGSIAVLMVFYAGYSLLTDAGGGDGFKRAKNILINLLVSGLVLFGFLLILYQVFAEFV